MPGFAEEDWWIASVGIRTANGKDIWLMRWKYKDQREWHPYFAWWPMVIDGEVIWLEYIETRLEWSNIVDKWDYRRCPAP